MLGPQAKFRSGQREAIETVAIQKVRTLLVQRTGWGKSIVYFIATKILREGGSGPTLLISPLLSLMRNQIEMAKRIGIQAHTIHSGNRKEWETSEAALREGCCDVLLISPERLSSEHFLDQVLPGIAGNVGMLVIDEAHCISDWGHDFRPDYRRIVRILKLLPKGVPVLGTTATANNRVVDDIMKQLGSDLILLRGPLVRTSLRLQNLQISSQAERLAWLFENIPRLPGSGIIYCSTIADTDRVAEWLQSRDINVAAYHAGLDNEERVGLEDNLINNQVKALASTVALGMGFDKPDLGFVVHFQKPGSVVAYYQQVGRAGRAMDRAYGIMLSGQEDDEIQEYFIGSAFPSVHIMYSILETLEQHEGLKIYELLAHVNIPFSVAEKALKILEVDGAVTRKKGIYYRTTNPWQPDVQHMNRITEQRRFELNQMGSYLVHDGCLMAFLEEALDDPNPKPCGRCANCVGRGFSAGVTASNLNAASVLLKESKNTLRPRKMWPSGIYPRMSMRITEDRQNKEGRSLCYYGDAGWGQFVRTDKYVHNRFRDELIEAAADLIQHRWKFPDQAPEWVTAIPSLRHKKLVPDFARKLARRLDMPFKEALVRTENAPEQKGMLNSSMQARNVVSSLKARDPIPSGPVLLIDDIWDSGWTMTVAGYLLREKGSGAVYPFALARTSFHRKQK
jgi:ATP-dependent DNA helicase RecQ